MQLETIIGLEIHIQLKTQSKLFCGCANNGEDLPPNTTICPICLGHPGTLPTLNKEALNQAILMASALQMNINKNTKFDRKNYFYPDLPKGYQISQFDQPVAERGQLTIVEQGQEKKIGITRLHLEEDAAKNIHSQDKTLVDYNRSGTPLIEIVSEPDLRSPLAARLYMQELRLIARYLGISDADMEKGHLRCDANISLRPEGQSSFSVKTELKNINSFKFVEKALQFEVDRQTQLWLAGEQPTVQSTRGWDAERGVTYEQRIKEGSDDYRYFPEPDLPNFEITSGMIKGIVDERMVELPAEKRKRFANEYSLTNVDIDVLIEDKKIADYFENVISELRSWLETEVEGDSETIWETNKKKVVKLAFGWLTTNLFKLMKDNKVEINEIKITAENLAEFITLVYQNKINSSAAQIILEEMYQSGADPSHVMEEKDLAQLGGGTELEAIVDRVISDNPEQVSQYQSGKEALLQYLIGMAMKASKGKADPKELATLFINKIKNS